MSDLHHERRELDLLSVESFSQLPFIRSGSAPREKSTSSAIRLFGIEVPHEPEPDSNLNSDEIEDSSKQQNQESTKPSTIGAQNEATNSRKFECHYCCRHFPTSQALGGHQNAHKRERQHAKRAHLQSAMAAAQHQHNIETHHNIYGLLNYPQHRFGASLASTPTPTVHYPSWHVTSSAQPISNNALQWRLPGVLHGPASMSFRQRPTPTPTTTLSSLLQAEQQRLMMIGNGAGNSNNNNNSIGWNGFVTASNSSSTVLGSQSGQIVCNDRSNGIENVSLDLHL